uniref:Uncharacterized protein n=1 Tax=Magallana gigas TaxID=29159 RepID=A0A8W8NZT1_MAGGI
MNRQTFFVLLLVAGILLTISEVEGKLGHFSSVRKLLRKKREINGFPENGRSGLRVGPNTGIGRDLAKEVNSLDITSCEGPTLDERRHSEFVHFLRKLLFPFNVTFV